MKFSDINIDIMEVDCDDMGDPYWRFYVVFYNKGSEIWSDYFHERPDDCQLQRCIEDIKDYKLSMGE